MTDQEKVPAISGGRNRPEDHEGHSRSAVPSRPAACCGGAPCECGEPCDCPPGCTCPS
jgi:hypothetical protein